MIKLTCEDAVGVYFAGVTINLVDIVDLTRAGEVIGHDVVQVRISCGDLRIGRGMFRYYT